MSHDDARERAAHLVPQPHSVLLGAGVLQLPAELPVRLDVPAEERAAVLRAIALLPMTSKVVTGPAGLRVLLRAGATPPEGYVLDVTEDGVTITAADRSGVVYAVQTLRQLLPDAAYRQAAPSNILWVAPVVRVEDSPRFRWRGMLLDVARHFLPKREVSRHIDLMSAHKLNTLHLHLSDDQGWRVESLRFPRLHEVGGWRATSQVSHYSDEVVHDGTPHGGYYTRDDLAEIIAYAADRAITVIPEIGVPGHTGALLAAYPEFGSPSVPDRAVHANWGVHDALLAPSERSLEFLRLLFDELLPLFPSPYVHVGGDESVLRAWEDDPVVRAFADKRGLSGSAEIFAALMAEVRQMLAVHGKTPVTWDDSFAAQGTAADAESTTTLVMAWRGAEVARRAAAAGHDVVLSPVMPTYFDYFQEAHPDEPLAIGGPVTLGDVASWEPIPQDWSEAESARVQGIQCQMWTEFVEDPRLVDYLLYPRTCAFAEIAWGSRTQDLHRRLPRHLDRLAAAGVEFRPLTGPAPWQRGGTGRRAHRAGVPMAERLANYAEAAATGTVADIPDV
ncbi:beta-N-acetylhexosaminidase [Amycolatopsis sp. cmx-11-51]|uniref:beta-N-acetylhexosaminidase n=1 Tax=Amycolatopsis sp. cmx-11-51 TaxID=2785797 RepID=UPI0039E5FB98